MWSIQSEPYNQRVQLTEDVMEVQVDLQNKEVCESLQGIHSSSRRTEEVQLESSISTLCWICFFG
jgi:hypothetical protein